MCDTLVPDGWYLEVEVFWRCLSLDGHEGGTLLLFPLHTLSKGHVSTQLEVAVYKPGKGLTHVNPLC